MKEALILASSRDPAGSGIAQALVESYQLQEEGEFEGRKYYCGDHVKVAFTEKSIVEADHVEHHLQSDFHIYVSKHRSEAGRPTLTAHFTGNFSSDASLGGKGRELAYTYPSLLKAYMGNLMLLREKTRGFSIVLEATHHGPTSLKKPVLFVEIGSSEKEWNNKEIAQVVAEALWKTLSSIVNASKVAVGLGGPHYSEKFTRFVTDSEFALASLAPKYALQYVEDSILQQMTTRTVEPVQHAALDWKGLGQEKTRILELVKKLGLEIVKL